MDDDVDEADGQVFIVHLVIVNATDENLIEIPRNTSRCVIFDNDRKFQFAVKLCECNFCFVEIL